MTLTTNNSLSANVSPPVQIPRLLRFLVLVYLTLGLSVRWAEAQTVRGRVLVGATTAPLPGAIVQALSADGTLAGSALSSATGFFAITPLPDGVYTLRVLRIGFRPFVGSPVTLANGQSDQVVIAWAGESFALTAQVITSNRTCKISADSGTVVSNVWDEARKAMLSAILAERGDAPLIARTNYSRTVTLDDEVVTRQQMTNEARHTFRAYASWAPESLAVKGYSTETTVSGRTVTVYRSPDAATLTSDSFAGAHCFSLVKGTGANIDDIGVAFTPTSKSNSQVEIEGTFWIDRKTSYLRYVDYAYVGLPSYAKNAHAGGRVDFTALRNGLWLLSNWRIRMPHIGTQRINGLDVQGLRLTAVDEAGGLVNSVSSVDTTLFTQALPSIALQMKLAGTNIALSGVKVGIVGTELVANTNVEGRVVFRNIVPGRYEFRATFPSLAMFGETEVKKIVMVNKLGVIDSLGAPDLKPLLKTTCSDQAFKKETVALFGTVRDTAGFDLVGGDGAVTVRVDSGDSTSRSSRVVGALIDLRGQYVICNAPRGKLTVEAENTTGKTVRQLTVPPAISLFEAPIVVAPDGPSTRTAVAVNASALAYLEIRVTDADLVPISRRRVQVTDADGKRTSLNTDTFGRVLFLNLKPGRAVIDVGDDADTVREIKAGRTMVLITIADPG
ncbi:MAG: carboxypeptidase-like regulatory domain-containing protein [Gemmatimonas sp.]